MTKSRDLNQDTYSDRSSLDFGTYQCFARPNGGNGCLVRRPLELMCIPGYSFAIGSSFVSLAPFVFRNPFEPQSIASASITCFDLHARHALQQDIGNILSDVAWLTFVAKNVLLNISSAGA